MLPMRVLRYNMGEVMFESKDILILLLGFGLGLIASIFANLVTGPILQTLIGYNAISILDRLTPRWMKNEIFTGSWQQNWHVKSTKFKPQNKNTIEFRRFLNQVATYHISKTLSGARIKYHSHGSVIDNRYVMGKWYDKVTGGYYGNFLLYIDPTRDKATGIWTGISSEKKVKSNKWEWQKSK